MAIARTSSFKLEINGVPFNYVKYFEFTADLDEIPICRMEFYPEELKLSIGDKNRSE